MLKYERKKDTGSGTIYNKNMLFKQIRKYSELISKQKLDDEW